MADIQLTPEMLLEQSTEMTSLMSSYETLFQQVRNSLDGVNQSWSTNIASNFTAKITSAQNSFSSILNMFSNGANAAKSSAMRFGTPSSWLSQIESVGSSVNETMDNTAQKVRSVFSEDDIDSATSKVGSGVVKALENVSGTAVDPVIGSVVAGTLTTLTEKSTYGDMKLGIQESENILAQEYLNCEQNGNLAGQFGYGALMVTQRASYNVVNTATNVVGSSVSGLGAPFNWASKATDFVGGKGNVVSNGLKAVSNGFNKAGSWLKNLM